MRMGNALIREDRVLVDLLDLYAQIGIDVLGRMREFNRAHLRLLELYASWLRLRGGSTGADRPQMDQTGLVGDLAWINSC